MAAMSAKPEVSFSYAQAAKGIAAPPQPAKPASIDSDKESPKPDEQNTSSNPQIDSETATPEAEAPRDAEKPAVSTDKESESAPTARPKQTESGTSTPSAGTSSVSAAGKDDESSNTPNGTSDSTWDKQSQSSKAEKPKNGAESGKEKSNSDSEKTTTPPKELKAAPLPSVNIWQQRKEAQDAKAKVVGPAKPDAATAQAGDSKTPVPASASAETQQDLSKASKKKGADGVSDAKDRKKTDGRKGRDDDMNLPPVGDASFWPTPQVAQGEEIRKAQEKTEKTEKGDKSPATRPHGKEKWMPVPYVPTAVFNTPLPSAGRRGGRAARGGRDGGRSGAYGAGDQGPAGKQSASADRARNEANTARANSLPAQSRRSNSADAAKSGDPRKNPPPADRSRGAKGAEDAAAGKENVKPQRDGKPFPRNQDFGAHKGADNNRNPRLNIDSQSGPRAGTPHDRRFENGPKSADVAGFNGERDNKENHFRESRGRGRGRGGGHAGYPGSQNHFVNHMPPFSHTKFGFNDRQRSHGLPNGSHQGHKMNIRSPSLPNSASMYGVYPFPTDVNTMYGYPAVPAGPMSAMPYQNYMEPFSLMSMISMQLEYYFSVDNLCKDLFLRKHMDSQGFVMLSFIAGFKRVKTLTEDFDLLRHVCRQLRNVEYQAGEDGVDRLRPREKWQQWVLPMAQRDPSGQHEGPPPPKQTDENGAPQNHMDGAPNGSAQGATHKAMPNGTGEHHTTGTPLSSAAPEFLPSKPVAAQSEDANVSDSYPPRPRLHRHLYVGHSVNDLQQQVD